MSDTSSKSRIVDKLDAGGMAEVYRGVVESSVGGVKKQVAIKKILPNLTKNKKFIQMFLDEARLSMGFSHANIVGVSDIGMADTAYFIVMDFVDGANLKTLIESLKRQNQRLPLPQVIYLMMEVCKGLQYAHDFVDGETGRELGIVHRDISPPNILVSKRGEVKLVDFGLAKATSQLETTDPGVVKGKFSYLSPEAASGKEVDRRADIFAVGILLFELITGKRLFFGETDYQTVELVRQAKVPSIEALNSDVKPELEQIIRRALARDVEERYAQAADLQDALAQYLFSQRMKVTSRDIEQLVQTCLREKQRSQPQLKKSDDSKLIDALINEEMVKFTSLEEFDAGGLSPSPAGDGGDAPLDPGHFVDTRGWADEGDSKGRRPPRNDSTGKLETLEDLLEGDGSVMPNASRVAQPIGGKTAGVRGANTSQKPPVSQVSSAKQQWNDSTRTPAPAPTGESKKKVVIAAVLVVVLAAGAGAVFVLRNSLFGDGTTQSQKR